MALEQKLSNTNYSNLTSAYNLIKMVMKDDSRIKVKTELLKIMDKINKIKAM